MRLLPVALLLALVAAVAAVAPPPRGRPAAAHPLGNFTVNHYTRLDLSAERLAVYRILDIAEIPAFREIQEIDLDGSGEADTSETDAYADATAARLLDGMTIAVDGAPVALGVELARASFPEGQGGLSLVRVEVTYTGTLPAGWEDGAALAYRDENDGDRPGWREVVVRGGPGVTLSGSDALPASISDELRAYPADRLSSPPDMRAASAQFEAGAGAVLPASPSGTTADAVRGNPDGALGRFADLAAREDLGWAAVTLALLSAAGFGALHALSPGHGKTVVAAYLVGSRGTWKHALFLAAVVTVTHTSSVYALGFTALYLSEYVLAENLYPWLGVASGVLVLALGATLLASRLRASELPGAAVLALRGRGWRSAFAGERGALALGATPHAHSGGAPHAHDAVGVHHHEHGHGPGGHRHRIPGQDGEPVTFRSLVGLGVFGGMIPCPSAIVVMLSAISLHRVGFGLLLIVAFSVGLAAVLSAIGFALVYGGRLTRRLPVLSDYRTPALAARMLPVLAALAVIAAGAGITLRAMQQF